MRTRELPLLVLLAASLAAGVGQGRAQVLRELESTRMKYRILLDGAPAPIGEAEASFRVVDTEQGPRLRVETRIHFATEGESPVEYFEEAELLCDELGPESFEVRLGTGEKERTYSGRRVGNEYEVTGEANGVTSRKTITAEVQRTNLGLFCGGFLAVPLDEGPLLADYPMLYPAAGDQRPRQKFREGILPLHLGPGESISVILTRIRKPNQTTDTYWHVNDEHQRLLRREEEGGLGKMVFELVEVDGVPTDLGSRIR